MGLDCAAAKFLSAAKLNGVCFGHTLTIGRQAVLIKPETIRQIENWLGLGDCSLLLGSQFAEPFFEILGAENVASLDATAFEGATHIHDLNQPIPASWAQQYSVVYDGGTLEHVFNVVQALKNCMEMVRVGGHFLQLTVANNLMGHGFWQFSPEVFYRALSPENGYITRVVLLHEVVDGGPWYAAPDPQKVGHRIELTNRLPTYILTIAKRINVTAIFARAPQQSDYAAAWEGQVVDWDAWPPWGDWEHTNRTLAAPFYRRIEGKNLPQHILTERA